MTSFRNKHNDDAQDSAKGPGRPKGAGKNSQILASLKIGDSIILPAVSDDASILQAARNRFYNPAKRLGIKLSFSIKDGQIRIRREA